MSENIDEATVLHVPSYISLGQFLGSTDIHNQVVVDIPLATSRVVTVLVKLMVLNLKGGIGGRIVACNGDMTSKERNSLDAHNTVIHISDDPYFMMDGNENLSPSDMLSKEDSHREKVIEILKRGIVSLISDCS
jgi:hypothetical protein